MPHTGEIKVLVLTPDLEVQGGVSNYYKTLALNKLPGIDYFYVNTPAKESFVGTALRLASNYVRFFKRVLFDGYDVVHINPSFNLRSFYRDGLFCFLSMLLNTRVLIFFRGWDDPFEREVESSRIMRRVFRLTYARCRHFIVLSKVFQDKLVRLGVKNARFWLETTVADNVKSQAFSLEDKINSAADCFNILFMSRIVASKGVDIAIDAVAFLLDNYPGFPLTLTIAGDGEELDFVKKYVSKRELHFVRFVGHVTGEAKQHILANSHILLFPTQYGEGMPNVVLECMLYGMPIISRRVGGISDVVIHGENGFLSDSKDYKTYSQFLLNLVADPQAYRKMAVNNHRKAAENFTSERVTERMLSIYREVALNEPPVRSRRSGTWI